MKNEGKRKGDSAALYCRLSQDDGNAGVSGSIQTQKTLLTQYCADNNIEIAEFYCDDGWSGTNFERPAFKKMIKDIEAGKIDLVIVKDLSRFGREYVQMGWYIEHYFEEEGVRFIAVGEQIDTNNGYENLLFPITNVINSQIARQASQKTKAAKQARVKAGLYLGGHAPFGYLKDPDDHHKLVVDPVAAGVVKEIFGWFVNGRGYGWIAKRLRREKILNPQAYFNRSNPDYFKSEYWRQDFDWHATSVQAILNNNVYIGQLVYGKTKTKGYFDKTRVAVPEEEWIVVDGTHEAIISKETWDTVHEIMKNRHRENASGETCMFAGLVKCAGCGSSMNASYNKKRGKYTGFSCWVYKNYGKERCTSHAIGWVALNKLVLRDIRLHAKNAQKYKKTYQDQLLDLKNEKKNEERKINEAKRKQVGKRLAELSKILDKLYEDIALGRLTEERYQLMFAKYEAEEMECKEQKKALTALIEKVDSAYEGEEAFRSLIRKYTDIKELDAYILNKLIKKIVVHEKVKQPDSKTTQQVDIYYKFLQPESEKAIPVSNRSLNIFRSLNCEHPLTQSRP